MVVLTAALAKHHQAFLYGAVPADIPGVSPVEPLLLVVSHAATFANLELCACIPKVSTFGAKGLGMLECIPFIEVVRLGHVDLPAHIRKP